MSYPRVLTIQDISCVGQCSLTVALPVISACGVETCILPSAVLSTHTGGFKGFTFRDLPEDMPAIKDHWVSEGIKFDAIYSGYLGSTKQIDYVADIFASVDKENTIKIVDPAMADHGKLYYGFDGEFVSAMKELCKVSDYVIPNITEAAFLTDSEFKTDYDREYIDMLLAKFSAMGCKNVIISGVSYDADTTGVVVYKDGEYNYYQHKKLPKSCHGTGDIFASALVGSVVRGKDVFEAAKIAADYVVECIKETIKDESHWYGAIFEPVLGKLIEAVNK
ncbi:MAG: pyridoxamine kinase [Oscillospiraceae bacterium]|nr:pyridoxamine kinase [Oscillospiraceae bacterium]